MKTLRLIDWQYVLGLMLLPVLVLVIAFLIGWIQGLVRYDPVYFTDEYLQRYATPSELLTDLETALRNGDSALLAALQGTGDVPQHLEPLPNVRFLVFWKRDGKYSDYLFMDKTNYHRYMQHVKLVKGRYVKIPETIHFYMDSGRWIHTFGPIMAIWWLVVILFTAAVWFHRYMAVVRKDIYGPRPRLTK